MRKEYESILHSRLQEYEGNDAGEAEGAWSRLESMIKEVADVVIREKKGKRNEDWFDEECARCISEKNKARGKMIQRETRINCEEYQKKRREANTICRGEKKQMLREELKVIEQYNSGNERR